MGLTLTLRGKTLPSIVGVASGTFGYGSEYEGLADFRYIGALYTKTLTLKPRAGNPPPRLVETPAGMLNAIGLANVGVAHFIAEILPGLERLPCAVIANIAGETESEYCTVLEKLKDCPGLWGYEVNISCPNVAHGGLAFGTDPAVVERLTGELRRRTDKPLIVKLSPNVTDIAVIARAAEHGGADAVTCINTLVGMAIDTKRKTFALANKTGGLSGPALRPVGVAMVYKVKRAVRIPVIGLGGILSGDDALQYLLAGASAIQVGTGNFLDADIHRKIAQGIEEFCQREKVNSLTELHALLE